MKKQKGITLIALIITIIVMLILVGVTITVSLNGGLFTTAKEATDDTQIAKEKEELLMAALGALNDNGKVDLGKLDRGLPEGFTGSDWEYTSKTGNVFKVSENGSVTLAGEQGEELTQYTAYSIGDEVTVGGENFYVITDSDETNPNVILLSKYSLNTAGTAQLNATYSETACAFSSTNYWYNDETGDTGHYFISNDLNSLEVPEGVTSVITTAKTYGEAKGGTGRLMTYEEASALVTNYAGIIYGTSINATDGYLFYWLGSGSRDSTVWVVDGDFSTFTYFGFNIGDYFGIRPVVEISKSQIK